MTSTHHDLGFYASLIRVTFDVRFLAFTDRPVSLATHTVMITRTRWAGRQQTKDWRSLYRQFNHHELASYSVNIHCMREWSYCHWLLPIPLAFLMVPFLDEKEEWFRYCVTAHIKLYSNIWCMQFGAPRLVEYILRSQFRCHILAQQVE